MNLFFVPTLGRTNYMKTLGFLQAMPDKNNKVIICCPKDEVPIYKKKMPMCETLVFDTIGIGAKRQFIQDYVFRRRKEIATYFMFDDDLDFYRRENVGTTKLMQIGPEELCARVRHLADTMIALNMPMCGISPRNGNNYRVELSDACVRMMTMFGCYTPMIYDHRDRLRWDTYEGIEDLTFTLRALRLGLPNFLDFYYAWNQNKGSNSSGGCSSWRTLEHHNAMVEKVHAEHPEFTTMRKANAKGWGNGLQNRSELTILWKNAFLSSFDSRREGKRVIADCVAATHVMMTPETAKVPEIRKKRGY